MPRALRPGDGELTGWVVWGFTRYRDGWVAFIRNGRREVEGISRNPEPAGLPEAIDAAFAQIPPASPRRKRR